MSNWTQVALLTNVKFNCLFCQQLCGYQLEQDVGQDIETVMAMLAKLEHELDTSSSRLIESVLKLRVSRWGRNTGEWRILLFDNLLMTTWILFIIYSYFLNLFPHSSQVLVIELQAVRANGWSCVLWSRWPSADG